MSPGIRRDGFVARRGNRIKRSPLKLERVHSEKSPSTPSSEELKCARSHLVGVKVLQKNSILVSGLPRKMKTKDDDIAATEVPKVSSPKLKGNNNGHTQESGRGSRSSVLSSSSASSGSSSSPKAERRNIGIRTGFESIAQVQDYFSKYGKICKFVDNPKNVGPDDEALTGSDDTNSNNESGIFNPIFITYMNDKSAAIAVRETDKKEFAINGIEPGHVHCRLIHSKYCNEFLNGRICQNLNCVQLHEISRSLPHSPRSSLSISSQKTSKKKNSRTPPTHIAKKDEKAVNFTPRKTFMTATTAATSTTAGNTTLSSSFSVASSIPDEYREARDECRSLPTYQYDYGHSPRYEFTYATNPSGRFSNCSSRRSGSTISSRSSTYSARSSTYSGRSSTYSARSSTYSARSSNYSGRSSTYSARPSTISARSSTISTRSLSGFGPQFGSTINAQNGIDGPGHTFVTPDSMLSRTSSISTASPGSRSAYFPLSFDPQLRRRSSALHSHDHHIRALSGGGHIYDEDDILEEECENDGAAFDLPAKQLFTPAEGFYDCGNTRRTVIGHGVISPPSCGESQEDIQTDLGMHMKCYSSPWELKSPCQLLEDDFGKVLPGQDNGHGTSPRTIAMKEQSFFGGREEIASLRRKYSHNTSNMGNVGRRARPRKTSFPQHYPQDNMHVAPVHHQMNQFIPQYPHPPNGQFQSGYYQPPPHSYVLYPLPEPPEQPELTFHR